MKPLKFPIVGVGASAGGLKAFSEFLKVLPENTGMAFVFVQHLDPKHPSLSADIFSRNTKSPVLEVKQGMRVAANSVYVIPPGFSMEIAEGVFTLVERPKSPAPSFVIDHFFKSLSEDQKNRAIGIILSGTGTDGTEGLLSIKANGGITFAQDPKTSEFEGMPKSAIDSGAADLFLSPKHIVEELVRLTNHTYVRPNASPAKRGVQSSSGDPLPKIINLLRDQCGIDFTQYKSGTVQRRIERRMVLHHFKNLEHYSDFLSKDLESLKKLCADMLIHVTSFFRNPAAFEALKKTVLPNLVKNRAEGTPIRIWVAGCSTGQEVYSLAIVLLEYLESKGLNPPIQIFASDISEAAIKKARAGEYPGSIAEDVSPEQLERFFVKRDGGGYKIAKSVRDLCIFSKHDLTHDIPFAKIDLISCRNLMIYFSPVLQAKVIPTFNFALRKQGYLFLGESEGISGSAKFFTAKDRTHKIYQKVENSNLRIKDFSIHQPNGKRGSKSAFILDLEKQLAETQSFHSNSVERAKCATEDLSSANEELQSANEELQSTNEELETAKEELQSTNEELNTVNDELQMRNLEQVQTNNDLVNLLGSVEIPIVMLGGDRLIRRFTPLAAKMFNLIPGDVGRPISDLRMNFTNLSKEVNLEKMISETIDTLQLQEVEVQDDRGRWSQLQVRPYKTIDHRIDGAVMALIDINSLKRAKQDISTVLNAIPVCVSRISPDEKFVFINKTHEKYFGPADTLIGKNIRECFGKDSSQFEEKIQSALLGEAVSFEWTSSKLADGHTHEFLVNLTPEFDLNGKVQGFITSLSDIDDLKKSQAEVELERKRLYDFFMLAPIPLTILLGPEHRFVLANKPYEDFVGRKVEGKTVAEAFTHAEVGTFVPILDAVYQSGVPFIGKEMLFQIPDSNQIVQDHYIEISYQPFRDSSGEVKGILALIQDLTDSVRARKLAEQNRIEIALEKARFEAIFYGSATALALFRGPDLVYEMVNSKHSELVLNREVIGKPILEVLPEIEASEFPAMMKAVYDTGEPSVSKEIMVPLYNPTTCANEIRYFDSTFSRITVGDGNQDYVIGHSTDVTGQVLSRKKLKAEKNKFEAIFYGTASAVALFKGPDFIFEMVNQKYQDLLPGKELIGLPIREALPELESSHIPGILKRVFETGQDFGNYAEKANILNPTTGVYEERYFDVRFSRIEDGEGHPYGVLNYGSEITDRIVAQKRLEETIQELKEERELRERFVMTITHDLRTPLTAGRMVGELLNRKSEDAVVHKMADRIVSNMDRAERMIRDLLDANRLKAGEMMPIDISSCRLDQVLQATVDDLIEYHGDRFEIKNESGATDGYWDPKAIQRVIENLAGNAIKYGDAEVKVTLALLRNKDQVEIAVHNEGEPISLKDQRKLFEPYHRTDSAVHSGKKGWGIGLSLVKSIAESHGGSVRVESDKGRGTTFFVKLPIDSRIAQPELPGLD